MGTCSVLHRSREELSHIYDLNFEYSFHFHLGSLHYTADTAKQPQNHTRVVWFMKPPQTFESTPLTQWISVVFVVLTFTVEAFRLQAI